MKVNEQFEKKNEYNFNENTYINHEKTENQMKTNNIFPRKLS